MHSILVRGGISMTEENYVIEMIGVTKAFGNYKANDDIFLSLKKGEIHALLGENGAGKSTLMNILSGLLEPTSGTIKVKGQEVKISSPGVADKLGIGMVHQHFMLVKDFTVTENIILGSEPSRLGVLNKKAAADVIDGSVQQIPLGSQSFSQNRRYHCRYATKGRNLENIVPWGGRPYF